MAAGLFLVLLDVCHCRYNLVSQAIHVLGLFQLVCKHRTRSYMYTY